MPRTHLVIWCSVLSLLAMFGPGPADHTSSAVAESSAEARTAAEIYERKSTIRECLEFVATDLKTRYLARPEDGVPLLLLVVDPTSSMNREIEALRTGLDKAWAAGAEGMRIGVFGIGVGEYAAPSRIPRDAEGALASLAFLPSDGPKNIHEGIREASRLLADEAGGSRALVLITEEGGEGEDDVERTREALFDAGAAFYCVAGESAFERSWVQTFEPRPGLEASGLSERYLPESKKRVKGELYFGGETAFGLVPYRWELDLAQSEYHWVRPPNYPVPSGFGFWSLATLCYTTGGRYFIFDFAAAALPKKQNQRRKSLYEYSRLSLLAPDLRPRKKVLKDLRKDRRAQTILKIWAHLADEKTPIVQTLGTLELRGGMKMRPARPVRSVSNPPTWYEDMDAVSSARERAQDRVDAVEQALKWWRAANGKERLERPGEDPLRERLEADFQLLGVQLLKVRFQWYEALAALDSIKDLDVTYRRTRVRTHGLMRGLKLPRTKVDLGDQTRNARFAEVVLAQTRLANKYPGTPWSLSMQKGRLVTFDKDVRVIEEPAERPTKPDKKKDKGKKDKPAVPKPKTDPPARPPPGPRPGSGTGGPTTGGG